MHPHSPTPARSAPRARRAAQLCALVAACLVAGAACAALYKWTDASGRVVYSDQPPPPNVKSEVISAPPPPANPNAAKEFAAKEAEARKKATERTEEAQKADQARTDAERRQAGCRDGRLRLRTLQEEQLPLFRLNERGERVYMDNADRRREIEQQQQWLRENCAT
jgi:hypothetical protein